MARFRPSRLFRRFSSHNHHDTSTSITSTTTPSTVDTPSSTPPLSHITTTAPPVLRKSRSLTKLRKRLHDPAHPNSSTPTPPPPPTRHDSTWEPSDSSPTHPLDTDTKTRSQSDPRPTEVTAFSSPGLDRHTGPASVDDCPLHTPEFEKTPLLVVQHATPVRLDATVDGYNDRLDRPISGEITLAATPDEYLTSEPRRHDDYESTTADVRSPASHGDSQPTTSPTDTSPDHPSLSPILRQPSIVDRANAQIVNALIDPPLASSPTSAGISFTTLPSMSAMLHRKIWVKRPGASPTLVQIREDDLVDDLRDVILRKYGNSLGKTFDAPDMTLHILTRQEHGGSRTERVLGPEEEMCRTLDSYFPGGQTVEEALIINVPQKRSTPRPSPRVFQPHAYHALDDYRPHENGTDYFPPMPAFIPTTIPQTASSHDSRSSHHHHGGVVPEHPPRSISVLNTGQVPPLPSPGAQGRRHNHRPKFQRQPTSSPTILSHPPNMTLPINTPLINPQQGIHRHTTRPRMDSTASETHHPNGVPPAPPLPTPPAPEAPPTNMNASTPPPMVGSSNPTVLPHRLSRPKRFRKSGTDSSSKSRHRASDSTASAGLVSTVLDGSVPPINVLIVEDNIINLRILEGLMKRLKVRWQTAMNGQIAVDKWRTGGYHLVLMDIQMPVMSGLQATKEIRRLERINGIGVFSSSAPPTPGDESSPNVLPTEGASETAAKPHKPHDPADDILSTGERLFKSPVIIVALTASSLQSDRHEALAAGCNDFLTKPVNFVWLERKVKEWGCMQALIDFDGWRQWKQFAKEKSEKDAAAAADQATLRAEKLARLAEKRAERVSSAGSSKPEDKEARGSSKRVGSDGAKTTRDVSGESAATAAASGGGGGGGGGGGTAPVATSTATTVAAAE